jgi:Arc/MetJ-type ribon-helix-helix transcriptional regulator
MNFALTGDLERLLRKMVEDGRFPNEEAVVQQALRSFLVEDPAQGVSQKRLPPAIQEERQPGVLIEDDTALGAFEIPRDGRELTSPRLLEPMRLPDRFPGE